MKSHPGTMESLIGRARTSAEKSGKGHHAGGVPFGRANRSATTRNRIATGPERKAPRGSYSSRFGDTEGSAVRNVQRFTGNPVKGSIHEGRRGEPRDSGPRKRSSESLNRGGDNGQHGSTVRSGISRRVNEVID
jgi:hypothetical protein